MPEPILDLADADFAVQMRGLVREAQREIEDRTAPASRRTRENRDQDRHERHEKPEKAEFHEKPERVEEARSPKAQQQLAEMLRPLAVAMQSVTRATGEHTQVLAKLDKVVIDAGDAQRTLPHIVGELHAMLEQKNGVSRMMFDALHEELRSYKDSFLLESVHRPMIRDLISLFDDVSGIHRQLQEVLATMPPLSDPDAIAVPRLHNVEMHLEHNIEFILEVLARLEVSLFPESRGKINKKTQRAVSIQMAEDPDEDMDVVRTVKRGFLWKDRVVRAEEVVVKKWKEGFLAAISSHE